MNLIEGLTSEHQKELEYNSECEFELESDDFNLNQIVVFAVEWATTLIPLSPKPNDLIQPSTVTLIHANNFMLKLFIPC